MQYRNDKYGTPLSILGYGCMRFTRKGNGIDIDKAEQELMTAYRAGVNYFDTAYIYPGSEEALGQILERNHIRDQVHIATKLPQFLIRNREAVDKYFDEELTRLRTTYIDYYLMHHVTDVAMWEKLKKVGILDWIRDKKASGAIRNIGFSYHGNTENFLKVLNDYDWDFCQIQYNYLDEVSQAGVKGLKAAAAKGIPVVIMEPLRGGKLVNMLPQGARDAMKKSGRGWSPAEWGLRWLYNQEEVTVVLSGMNSEEMVKENCRIASETEAGSMTEADFETLEAVKKSIRENEKVGCTGCRYCMPSRRPWRSPRSRPSPRSASGAASASSTVRRAFRSGRSSRRPTRPCARFPTRSESALQERSCSAAANAERPNLADPIGETAFAAFSSDVFAQSVLTGRIQ